MSICRAFDEWIDKKIDDLDADDKFYLLKSFGYGALSAIPDCLVAVGLSSVAVATCNMVQGKGFTINPKD